MNDFVGVVSLRFDQSTRVDVNLEFLHGYVIMRAPENQWLGSWTATEFRKSHVGGSRFHLSLKEAKLIFDVEEPARFLEALEAAEGSDERSSSSLWDRLRERVAPTLAEFGSSARHHPVDEEVEEESAASATPAIESSAGFDTERETSTAMTRLQAEIAGYQQDVVEWLEGGMRAWFEFYFLLGPQNLRERLAQAAGGLEKAALQLHTLSDQLKELEFDDREYELVAVYADGVGTWASALDQIAVACRLDQRNRAADGFTKLNQGTAMIEELVAQLPEVHPSRAASLALSHLDAIEPEAKVSTKSLARAKEPWRRALLSACWARDKSRLGVSLSSATRRLRGDSST